MYFTKTPFSIYMLIIVKNCEICMKWHGNSYERVIHKSLNTITIIISVYIH